MGQGQSQFQGESAVVNSKRDAKLLGNMEIWQAAEWMPRAPQTSLRNKHRVITMVYLNRIYTKTGDSGETSLGDGRRVAKTDLRIAAYGGVDELNSVIGLGLAAGMPEELSAPLRRIQNDLFDLGADLCVPELPEPTEYPPLRMTESQVTQLEQLIDGFNDRLEPLTSFILPGGSLAAGHLHLARTVCRRVEIGVIHLTQSVQGAHRLAVIYLNRLSDLLFVMGRIANNDGRADVKWVPGANRSGERDGMSKSEESP